MEKQQIEQDIRQRVSFIKQTISAAGADGIIFGNSGGKDSALVGILCKMACENTVGITLPCGSRQNYESDMTDAKTLADMFNIEIRNIPLTDVKNELVKALGSATKISDDALSNIAPRLRMTTLYAVAASENRLVAGTSNKSEAYMGYFTKWGDGGCDFNPIADLTVTEIYAFLRHLNVPKSIIEKAPSGGLFDGQTDEGDMGVSYRSIDAFLSGEAVSEREKSIIQRYHKSSAHKRKMPAVFKKD